MTGCRPSVPTDCPNANDYCKVLNCAATGGMCTPKPPISNVYTPVCGCDNITYWNEPVAHSFRTNVKAQGECAAGSVTPCNGGGVKCPEKRFCNRAIDNSTKCLNGAINGVCWGLPPTCPAGLNSTQCSSGGSSLCLGKCEAILDERPYYSNLACIP